MFLVLIHYKLPYEEVQNYVQAHRDYLEGLYQQKKLIVSGPMKDLTGGVILMNVQTEEEAQEIITHDPYYINQVGEYEVIPFSPVKSDIKFKEYFIQE
ncbi:YciI family protein [Hazenella coriacea]|uniref:Uncharacterized protein YciI n=1 Tax=Hazenella coriacea TaxID=1179467 RepID=A0A4R3LAC0_9BACL|nr:YciI family protein [Hazenella coriacea]TCS96793.1 uncharacterized protein YciI [Hazenella coriacea]